MRYLYKYEVMLSHQTPREMTGAQASRDVARGLDLPLTLFWEAGFWDVAVWLTFFCLLNIKGI